MTKIIDDRKMSTLVNNKSVLQSDLDLTSNLTPLNDTKYEVQDPRKQVTITG